MQFLRFNHRNAEDLPVWPGMVFTAEHEEVFALLASPNASSVVYMLAQHFSNAKKIVKVVLYADRVIGNIGKFAIYMVLCT